MSLLFRPSDRELVKLRDDVFQKRGAPALARNGFVKSPFSTAWFGKNDKGGYSYEYCRLSASRLDMVFVHINRGDRWVQLRLNVFVLQPRVNDIEQLMGQDGLQFHLPPNSGSQFRITKPGRTILARAPDHKLRLFFSHAGLKRRLDELGDVLERDLSNIDRSLGQWLAEHEPLITDWRGVPIASSLGSRADA